MRRAAIAWLAILTLAVPAVGDRVVLKDGRTFEGTVTESEGKVVIEHAYGTISFSASEVASIERGPTAAEQLEMQLALINRTDPEALFELSKWARNNDLPTQAKELLKEVLELDGDHPGARKLLGYVRADGKWLDVPAAMQLAQGKLEAGQCRVLLKELLPALEEVAGEAKQKLLIKDLQANSQLRVGQFAEALKSFELLASKTSPPESLRYAAVAEILKSHADGMYVVTEPYPPVAMLLGPAPPAVEPGPASLAEPAVLASALRDRARAAIRKARAVVEEGRRLETTEPEAAKAKYALAGKDFDLADAVVPNIARSYRVEIARRRIAMITKSMNIEAEKFDTLKAELGKRDMTPAGYRDLLVRMLRALNHVHSDLGAILQITGPFERELVLEVTDATHRLQRVNALRDVLTQELNGK